MIAKTGRATKIHQTQLFTAPGRAENVYQNGDLITCDARGFALPGVQSQSVEVAGVLVAQNFPDQPANTASALDMRGQPDGQWFGESCERGVNIDTVGVHLVDSVREPEEGEIWAYLVDANTVTPSPTPEALILGRFKQPAGSGQYWVDIAERNPVSTAYGAPIHYDPPVMARLLATSAAVAKSDIVTLNPTGASPGYFVVEVGTGGRTHAEFFGVAARSAQPGELFPVWRRGAYPVRAGEGELATYQEVTWSGSGIVDPDPGDAVIGRLTEDATNPGDIVIVEINPNGNK